MSKKIVEKKDINEIYYVGVKAAGGEEELRRLCKNETVNIAYGCQVLDVYNEFPKEASLAFDAVTIGNNEYKKLLIDVEKSKEIARNIVEKAKEFMAEIESDVFSAYKSIFFHNPLFLDTETTGLGADDEIVEIALVDANGQVVFESLVKPTKIIQDNVINIHGITNEMVANAPTWPDVHDEINNLIKNNSIVMYRAEFDIRLMQQTANKYNLEMNKNLTENCICAREIWRNYRGHYEHLSEAASHCGIKTTRAHRAADDAITMLQVMRWIATGGATAQAA